MEGEKSKIILELREQGLTHTEIMKKTGFSLAWIRETIMREEADKWHAIKLATEK